MLCGLRNFTLAWAWVCKAVFFLFWMYLSFELDGFFSLHIWSALPVSPQQRQFNCAGASCHIAWAFQRLLCHTGAKAEGQRSILTSRWLRIICISPESIISVDIYCQSCGTIFTSTLQWQTQDLEGQEREKQIAGWCIFVCNSAPTCRKSWHVYSGERALYHVLSIIGDSKRALAAFLFSFFFGGGGQTWVPDHTFRVPMSWRCLISSV